MGGTRDPLPEDIPCMKNEKFGRTGGRAASKESCLTRFQEQMTRTKPKRLVFSGGGTRCLVFLSTLEVLEDHGWLTDVKEWWGTSAGALVAAILAITHTRTHRTSEILFSAPFHLFRDINIANLVNISESWGLDDAHALLREIEALLDAAHPGAAQWTLQDVPGFHAVVADLNAYDTVVCSAARFPTLKLSEAIRASMSLPVFYRPYQSRESEGHIWIDGGLKAAFPWACLASDRDRHEALGFAFERPWSKGPRTFTEYLLSMLHFEDPKQIPRLMAKWPEHILWYPSPPFPAWYVRLGEDDKAMLRGSGEDVGRAWLLKREQSSPGMNGNPPLCEDRCTPSPADPGHHTGGLLEIPRSSDPSSRHQAPSRDSRPCRQPLSRRWSF
jgi:NTE family protein